METTNKVDISVLVCCYNPDIEKLKNTIRSIKKQEKVKYEIVITDDGSKENYSKQLGEWTKQENIELICMFHPKNEGTVRNILKGLEKCSGEYIKTISPGDYLHDKLTLYTFLSKCRENDNDLIFGDATYYNDSRIIDNRTFPRSNIIFNKKKFAKSYYLYGYYFVGAAFMIKKELFTMCLDKIRNHSKLQEDFPTVCISILEGYKIDSIEYPMVWYEFGTGISTSSVPCKQLVEDGNNILEFLFNTYSTNKLVKRMYLKQKILKYNKFVKCFCYLILFPDYVIRKLLDISYKPKVFDTDINKMFDMIR